MNDLLPGEEKPKRTPRKRSATPRVRKTTSRRTTAPIETVASEPVTPTQPAAPARRAPTTIAESRGRAKKQRTQPLIITAIVLLSIGVSAAIGFTDKGRIDVAETIEARNQRILNNATDERDAGTPTDVLIPVQNTQVVPTSALIPIPDDQLPPPPPPAASSTASSTATSTETVAENTDTSTSIGEQESTASSSSDVSETTTSQ